MCGCLLSGLCIQVLRLKKPSLWLTFDYYTNFNGEKVKNLQLYRNNLIVLPFEIIFYNVFLEICVVST